MEVEDEVEVKADVEVQAEVKVEVGRRRGGGGGSGGGGGGIGIGLSNRCLYRCMQMYLNMCRDMRIICAHVGMHTAVLFGGQYRLRPAHMIQHGTPRSNCSTKSDQPK